MSPVEALKLALSKEIEAEEMYQKFSAKYPTVKDIFVFLAGEEQKHKAPIKKRISEVMR